jgi:hypothetical protein
MAYPEDTIPDRWVEFSVSRIFYFNSSMPNLAPVERWLKFVEMRSASLPSIVV